MCEQSLTSLQYRSMGTTTTSMIQVLTGFFISVAVYLLFTALKPDYMRRKRSGWKEPPEPGFRWPVIGHLHLLRGSSEPLFRKLARLADEYGPAVSLRLGRRRTVVISSHDLAKECFTTNDKALSNRPASTAGEHMGYDNAMFGFTPYGPYWVQVRKMVASHLISNTRLNALRGVPAAEFHRCVNHLWNSSAGGRSPVNVELKGWCADLTHRVILEMVVGKKYLDVFDVDGDKAEMRFKDTIAKFFRLTVASQVTDVVPFLKWVDLLKHKKAMKKTGEEMDFFLQRWLDDHKKKMTATCYNKGQGEDFMDIMLSTAEEMKHELHGYDLDTVIKSTCMALILGGTDTTSVSLAEALFFTLSNPEVLRKAREEVDAVFGKERLVKDYSDVKNLLYHQAIVKETLRFSPAAPALINREAIQDCKVGGFDVAAGTQVVVNIWKVHHDPSLWPNPSEFKPERFLAVGNGYVKDEDHMNSTTLGAQHFDYIPFGAGRRLCPGGSFALQIMQLGLARLIQAFDMEIAPESMSAKVLYSKDDIPLHILFTPRLPSKLYE